MSKKKPDARGFVYSTDPNFNFEENIQHVDTLPAAQQRLRVRLDTKHRAGKAVTLIEGFIGTNEDLAELGRRLKSFCGTGGSVKGSEIIIQGDQREKVITWLTGDGYTQTKRS